MSQIKRVTGGVWDVEGYFKKHRINPIKQGENQLKQLMKMFTELELCRKISAVVAVSYTEKQKWLDKGLEIENQPILFKDSFGSKVLVEALTKAPTVYSFMYAKSYPKRNKVNLLLDSGEDV